MQIALSLLISGVLILAVNLWRIRRTDGNKELQSKLEDKYSSCELDFSGETEYTWCASHDWILDNVVRKDHSRIGNSIQSYLMDNTLPAIMVIGLAAGISSILIGLIFLQSIILIGTAGFVFLVGGLVAMGPNGPRVSENLLAALSEHEFEKLNDHDLVYVTLANQEIKNWFLISMIMGVSFVFLSPIGDFLPTLLAAGIAVFSDVVLWGPAFALGDYSYAFSIIYLAGMPILLIYILPRTILSFVRKNREPKRDRYQV